MDGFEGLLLALSAFAAGAINAVAGGGSFFTFPTLLLAGVLPIPANATSTVALWPGSLASAWGYRQELREGERETRALGWVSGTGGLVGALLLVATPQRLFMGLLPFLLLIATLLFTFGPRLRTAFAAQAHATRRGQLLAVQGLISIYGGYFGGGMGLMMLAAFTLLGMSDIHRMNGLKSLLGVLINAVAVATFAVAGLVAWRIALPMTLAAIGGGYLGARGAKRMNPAHVRVFISTIGWSLTAYFFWQG